MLVYGDHKTHADTQQVLASLRTTLAAAAQSQGLRRHGLLVTALIEAGRLQQGLEDAGEAELPRPVATLTYDLAEAVVRSWDSDFTDLANLPAVPDVPRSLEVVMTVPEGYAFYALYPEAYAEAARRVALRAPPRVIGIRSIGTSLGAMAAAAIGAPPPITVRPTGDPFDRQLSLSPAAGEALLAGEAHYLIVDEGPGLSASSFGAVIGWLESAGVPAHRITVLPSHHGGPGASATPKNRARWSRVDKAVADFGPDLGARLGHWAQTLLGPLDEPLHEISGGGWRAHRGLWPAVNPIWERRKFLAKTGSDTWLLKFAGLGEEGMRKLALARALHADGFTPEPVGVVHGFLVERWHGDARALQADETPLDSLAAYITSRGQLPAPVAGASIADLLVMAKRNIGLALGEKAASALSYWDEHVQALQTAVRPVCTDNRMDRHEWLVLPDGRVPKTDAVDHHAGHDLIGCQDLAWDVVGAADAFDLEAEVLVGDVERVSGRTIDRALLRFYEVAHAAFRLGQAQMSADMLAGDTEDQGRHLQLVTRYRGRLELDLLGPSPWSLTRPSLSR